MKRNVPGESEQVTRRSFLREGAAAIGGLTVAAAASKTSRAQTRESSFLELLRPPDGVTAYARFERTLPAGTIPLQRTGIEWRGGQVVVECTAQPDALVLTLVAPSTQIAAVHLRWQAKVTPGAHALGDAWERSYGDLGWRNLIPERVMPWYFATHDGAACHGYGVKTDAAALCFWQLDPEGVSLWLNVTNGGDGVELGQRKLTMATVVTRRGVDGETHRKRWRRFAGVCAHGRRGRSCPSMARTIGATATGEAQRRQSCGIRSSSPNSRRAEVCGPSR
jgi:alpha-galactosidase